MRLQIIFLILLILIFNEFVVESIRRKNPSKNIQQKKKQNKGKSKKNDNKCKPNETKVCASLCKRTCSDPYVNCGQNCSKKQCECKAPYVYNEKMKKCTGLDKCPQPKTTPTPTTKKTTTIKPTSCPQNETIIDENTITCEGKCYGLPQSICTDANLGTRCECMNGYVRNASNICILGIDCPLDFTPITKPKPSLTCVYPFKWTSCRSACPPTCSSRRKIECLNNYCLPPGCACMEPFALNSKGECVRKIECDNEKIPQLEKTDTSKIKCPENMVLVKGRSSCEKKCGESVDYSRCMRREFKYACECPYPFVINKTGICIRNDDDC
uniref:TIL domain-containing protein n=1 Tax=Parastrongyloides trichosuri TaxID=131310 RepID=A0A0N4Z9X5_PARTI